MNKKQCFRIAKFIVVFLIILVVLADVMRVNDVKDTVRIRGFYDEPENTLDVVMLGASEVYTAIAPGRLWKDYGFTSYDYAISGMPVSMMPTAVREIRSRQNPKLIVIEINGATTVQKEYQTNSGKWHIFLDNIPWSDNKRAALREWIPEDEQSSYYIPFLKYHENWRTPAKCGKSVISRATLALHGETYLKGMQTRTETLTVEKGEGKKTRRKRSQKNTSFAVREEDLLDVTDDDETSELQPVAEHALKELLDYLKKNEVDNVLFIRLPHNVTKQAYGNFRRGNRVGEIIKEYGFAFINMQKEWDEIGLDWKQDFYNSDHMNVYGQEKFTDYFGKFLTEHYALNGLTHSDETVERWDKAAEETTEFQEYALEETGKNSPYSLNETWRMRQWWQEITN